jgi:hypothetical protein
MSLERSENIESSLLIPTNISNISIIDRNSKICEKITKKPESLNITSHNNQNSSSQHTSPVIIKNNNNSSISNILINSNSNSNINTHNNCSNTNNTLNINYNSPQGTSFLSAHPAPHHEHHASGGSGFHIHRRQSFLHRTDSDFDMQTPKALLLRLQLKEQ